MAINTQGAVVDGGIGAAVGGLLGLLAAHAVASGKPGKKNTMRYALGAAAIGAAIGGYKGANAPVTATTSSTTTTTTTAPAASATP